MDKWYHYRRPTRRQCLCRRCSRHIESCHPSRRIWYLLDAEAVSDVQDNIVHALPSKVPRYFIEGCIIRFSGTPPSFASPVLVVCVSDHLAGTLHGRRTRYGFIGHHDCIHGGDPVRVLGVGAPGERDAEYQTGDVEFGDCVIEDVTVMICHER